MVGQSTQEIMFPIYFRKLMNTPIGKFWYLISHKGSSFERSIYQLRQCYQLSSGARKRRRLSLCRAIVAVDSGGLAQEWRDQETEARAQGRNELKLMDI